VGLPIVLPKIPSSLKAGAANLNLPARSTVMSQDTGMAMTLISYRGFTRRPSH
jgi:hypothetical protein